LLHVWTRAIDALGTDAAARTWLTTPHSLLDGEAPIERLDTEPGLRMVEDMLTVIDETGAA
jgi:putative toxin-antitoxin system antitoxin component (TIGR02293 family)